MLRGIFAGLIALVLATGSALAQANINNYPNDLFNLQPNMVLGRVGGIGFGPAQQIPFSLLASLLTALTVGVTPINAGIQNGILFDSNGILLNNGPVISANAIVAGNGQWSIGGSSTNGIITTGQGSINDWCAENSTGTTCAIAIPTGTNNVVMSGLGTTGTITSALCMTASGLMLRASGTNCFGTGGPSTTAGLIAAGNYGAI